VKWLRQRRRRRVIVIVFLREASWREAFTQWGFLMPL
jgi:hypothetical protein